MERRRVVITGLGAITPVGLTAVESWQAVKDGACGIAPITQFDPSDMKVKLAAEVKDFVPENYLPKPEIKRMGRFTQFAVVSAMEAMADANFTLDEAEADRCGVIVSSGIGGLFLTEAEHDKGKEKGWDRVSPFYIPMGICNMAAGQIAIHTGFRGMCSCPVTACTGGTNAVGDAFHYIRDGYADVMLCGGTEMEYIESKGATVDGIGTQMHIAIDSNKDNIAQMFQKLGATGKLIKVSELDIKVNTSSPTTENLAQQAEMYQYVIDMYKKYIPADKQYGITIWGVSDNEKEHVNWIPNDAPNLWDANYARKHAYKGVADGLAGKDVSGDFTGDLE